MNKGSLNGVYIGQTVVDARGVVGQVVSVFTTSSRVLMISDSSHSIPVRVVRNNVRSIATGSGQINRLTLRNVTDTTDIKVGDQLVSSGLGKKFPTGYPVATVTRVKHDPGKAYAIIYARPNARLEQLASVLLIWTDAKKRDVKMINSDPKGRMVILLSFGIAMFMNLLPLPHIIQLFKPDFVALVLIYWVMAIPDRMGVISGWIVGLFVDALYGSVLGIHAMSFALIAYLILMTYHRLRLFPRWKQSINIAVSYWYSYASCFCTKKFLTANFK
ncbi:MAG: rod shape-determining protein MreC [Enterobacterales bacterium]|nr:rod shape-determining protein MreC [Enterobacterales bacterium]